MKSFENPDINQETSYEDVLDTVQRISRKWLRLIDKVKSDPNALGSDTKLLEINELTSSPKTGIQQYFEGQIKFIEESTGGNENTKNIIMYRLKEDLERIKKS